METARCPGRRFRLGKTHVISPGARQLQREGRNAGALPVLVSGLGSIHPRPLSGGRGGSGSGGG